MIRTQMKKRCYKCKKEKELKFFSWSNKSNGIYNGRCKECQKKLSTKHYDENKDDYLNTQRVIRERNKRFIYNYLKDKKCFDCNNDNIIVLDFDHIDPEKKRFNISDAISDKWSIKNLKLEILKCEIRCRNCHQIKTAKDFGHFKYIFGLDNMG